MKAFAPARSQSVRSDSNENSNAAIAMPSVPVYNMAPVHAPLQAANGTPNTGTSQRKTLPSVKPSNVNGQKVVQRMLTVKLGKELDPLVKVTSNSKRPPGGLPGGSQGDHTTPFVVLQAGVFNAIAELPLLEAWDSLKLTYDSYKQLPGWETTKKSVTNNDAYVLSLLNGKGDINDLQEAVNQMLWIRNQIDLTSLNGGTTGHGEAGWFGGIQQHERKLQLHNDADINATKDQILVNMFWLFEHDRVGAMTSEDRKRAIIKQHSLTMVDAFPLVSAKLKITSKDVEKELLIKHL